MLLVKATEHMIYIYDQGKQVKVHQRLAQKGLWSTDIGRSSGGRQALS